MSSLARPILARMKNSFWPSRPVFTNWQSQIARQYRLSLANQGNPPGPLSPPSSRAAAFQIVTVGRLPRATAPDGGGERSRDRPRPESTISLSSSTRWIIFLDRQTRLWPGSLASISQTIKENPQAELLYGDTEIVDRRGRRLPYFKPDYSPDLLLAVPYFGAPIIIARQLVQKLTLRPLTDPVFLWDLALKAVEVTKNIVHLPKLIASQQLEGPLPSSGWPRPDPARDRCQRLILRQALARRRMTARVATGPFPGSYRILYKPEGRLVTIIISTKDRLDLLRPCLDGLLRVNDYPNWELVLVNNNSREPETLAYFSRLLKHRRIRVLDYLKPFNIAAIFNFAVKQARGDYLVFMGNDTEPITPQWLTRLVGYIQRPEVGAVGAKLLYPDGTLQHAGVILGYGSARDKSDHVAGHPYCHFPVHPGYFGAIELQRNYSAVTGAVMMTRKSLYQKVGGYDGENLPVLFNDVDYCLKLRRLGYLIVYAPEVILYHRERASLGQVSPKPEEIKYMRDHWHFWEDNDPFYNHHLTLTRPDYTLRMEGE